MMGYKSLRAFAKKKKSMNQLYTSSNKSAKTGKKKKKVGREADGHVSKEDIQIANRHMKRCSTSLIREM